MGLLYPPPPSASLPPLNTIVSLSEAQIMTHIQNLVALYCPLAFDATSDKEKPTSESPVDSGYASEAETESNNDGSELRLEALRADAFERKTVERWLTGFMARAETLACFSSDAACQHALDQASWVLESFFASTADEGGRMGDGITDYTRTFSFDLPPADGAEKKHTIEVRLNDGLAGMNSSEPDDVGLQSWGASIVFSKMICAEPSRFLLDYTILGTAPRVVELGAGTGLVSIALASLLPRLGISHPTVVATDYHPAVLANLRANIEANFLDKGDRPIRSCALDWAVAELNAPLDVPADVLVATDAVYAPEHAALLRDCATLLLASEGVFWLVMTVRPNGKFEAVGGTVEAAFEAADRPKGCDGRQLTILSSERLEKHQGIGRGDESYYKLYRIGWA